jgi:hypothetical protein
MPSLAPYTPALGIATPTSLTLAWLATALLPPHAAARVNFLAVMPNIWTALAT